MSEPATTPGRIVVGVDGSPNATAALAWAAAEADRRHSELLAVIAYNPLVDPSGAFGAAPPSVYREGLEEARRTLAEELGPVRAQRPGLTVTPEVLEGDPVQALLTAAKGAEMLVVGSHPGWLGLLASTARGLTRHATCPVVIVPLAAGHGAPAS